MHVFVCELEIKKSLMKNNRPIVTSVTGDCKALSVCVPVLLLMSIMSQEKSKNIKGSLIYVEAKALMNCPLIVEAYTDKPKRTRQSVQFVLKKYG